MKTETYTLNEFLSNYKNKKDSKINKDLYKFSAFAPLSVTSLLNLTPVLKNGCYWICFTSCTMQTMKIVLEGGETKEMIMKVAKTVGKHLVLLAVIEIMPYAFIMIYNVGGLKYAK